MRTIIATSRKKPPPKRKNSFHPLEALSAGARRKENKKRVDYSCNGKNLDQRLLGGRKMSLRWRGESFPLRRGTRKKIRARSFLPRSRGRIINAAPSGGNPEKQRCNCHGERRVSRL